MFEIRLDVNTEELALLQSVLKQIEDLRKARYAAFDQELRQAQAVVDQEVSAEEKPKRTRKAKTEPAAAVVDNFSAAPSAEGVVSAAAVAVPAPASAITLEQVRARLAELSQAGKTAQVKELLAARGVARLTEVKPEDYQGLMAAAEGL